jgi:hypothetical protein
MNPRAWRFGAASISPSKISRQAGLRAKLSSVKK